MVENDSIIRLKWTKNPFESYTFESNPWRQKSAKIPLTIISLTAWKPPLPPLTAESSLFKEAQAKFPVGHISYSYKDKGIISSIFSSLLLLLSCHQIER